MKNWEHFIFCFFLSFFFFFYRSKNNGKLLIYFLLIKIFFLKKKIRLKIFFNLIWKAIDYSLRKPTYIKHNTIDFNEREKEKVINRGSRLSRARMTYINLTLNFPFLQPFFRFFFLENMLLKNVFLGKWKSKFG